MRNIGRIDGNALQADIVIPERNRMSGFVIAMYMGIPRQTVNHKISDRNQQLSPHEIVESALRAVIVVLLAVLIAGLTSLDLTALHQIRVTALSCT